MDNNEINLSKAIFKSIVNEAENTLEPLLTDLIVDAIEADNFDIVIQIQMKDFIQSTVNQLFVAYEMGLISSPLGITSTVIKDNRDRDRDKKKNTQETSNNVIKFPNKDKN